MPVNSFENYPMSWRPSLEGGEGPLYMRLAELLARDVANGRLRPGVKLPPQRELADFLDVNVSTVSRAFKLCAQRGLISGAVGSGTYVAYDVSTNVMAGEDASHLIELGAMTPETIPQEETAAILSQMLREPDAPNFFQYSPRITDWQREAAVRLLARAGCPAPPGRTALASGGQNALAAILAACLRPGDKLGVDPLVFPGLKSAARLLGIQLCSIAQEGGEMSEAGIRHGARAEGIRALYVTPDFHNPTGRSMSLRGRQRLAALAEELGLLVIEDGICNLLSASPPRSIYSLAPENTVFILSLSKTLCPALRLAYLALPPAYGEGVREALYSLNLSQSALLTELAAQLILSPALEPLLQRRRQGAAARNRLAERVLEGCTLFGGGSCLCRYLLLPKGLTGAAFERLALAENVRVYGAERFAVGRDAPIAGARLALCAPSSPERLEEGLLRLRDILAGL